MAYLEIHQSLPTHKKTIRASSKLKISRHLFMGNMLALWCWGLDNVDADGVLEDAYPEEIAAAAGVADKKATAFVDTLVEVHFLDRDGDKLRFHNWKRYTWRVYDLKEGREAASADGKKGNHVKWHVDRGIVSPTCEFCIAPESPPNRVPDNTRVGSDIAPESQTLSHSLPPDTPSILPSETPATNVTPLPVKGVASSPFNLMPREWAEIYAKFPNETSHLFGWFKEWADWNEKKGVRASELESKVGSFIGFVLSKQKALQTAAAASR